MELRDLLQPDSKLFIKSEWGPASDDWPAISFSKQAVGRKMRGAYDPAKDFVIYVGTMNPRNTPKQEHRSRLLSLVRMDLRRERTTQELIPTESWKHAQEEHGDRWFYAFAMLQAWDFVDLPSAREFIPETYSSLRNPATFGDFVPIADGEASRLLNLDLIPVPLKLQEAGKKDGQVADYLAASRGIKEMIRSMAFWIEERRAASGTSSIRNHPERKANPRGETELLLFKKWTDQGGLCGLCHQPIPVPCLRGMLQPSPDRIDSRTPNYDDENVHITHLGCNYAKNQFSVDQFEEWLEVLKGLSADVTDLRDPVSA